MHHLHVVPTSENIIRPMTEPIHVRFMTANEGCERGTDDRQVSGGDSGPQLAFDGHSLGQLQDVHFASRNVYHVHVALDNELD